MTGPRIVMPFPLSLGMGGGGTFDCLELSRSLARAGARVLLLPVQSSGPFRFPRPAPGPARDGMAEQAELRELGIDVRPLGRHPLHFLLDGRVVRRAVRRLLREEQVDAVCGWGYESAFLAPLLARARVPFAMNAAASYAPLFRPGGSPLRGRRAWQAERLHARPFREADLVFARSRFTKDEIVRFTGAAPERVQVLHIAPEPRFLELPRSEVEEPLTRFLYAGGFVHDKGFFDALTAFGAAAPHLAPGWRLRLVGWGDPELARRKAEAAGIAEHVEVRGAVPRAAFAAELSWAQLACLPSYTESFGLTVAEAQAAGLAVLAYAAGAVPEVVADGESAWLVPRGEVTALGRALAELAADPGEVRRRGAAGRRRMTSEFTWERTARSFLSALANLADAP